MARSKMGGIFFMFTSSVRVEQFCVDLDRVNMDAYF
jgi:hypothetical protein